MKSDFLRQFVWTIFLGSMLLVNEASAAVDCASAKDCYKQAKAAASERMSLEYLNAAIALSQSERGLFKYWFASGNIQAQMNNWPLALTAYQNANAYAQKQKHVLLSSSKLALARHKTGKNCLAEQGFQTLIAQNNGQVADAIKNDYQTFLSSREQQGADAKEIGCGLTGKSIGVVGLCPKVTLYINFAYNSAQIDVTGQQQLQSLADTLQEERFNNHRFRLVGHTDSQGSAAYNKKLSEKRSAQVKMALTKTNAKLAQQLTAIGYGEERLLFNPDTEVNEQKANRRVEIEVLCR